ncbi:MAG: biosynthetic arginine decarboxylase [Pirellulaceae bacterium]
MLKEAVDKWTVHDSNDLYGVARWSQGYFTVGSDGNLLVRPGHPAGRAIDMKELVDRLQVRGLDLPILLRFNGILKDRLRALHDAFATAIEDHSYQGQFSCVYPIKVNQQRQVIEKVVEYGRPYGFGLEAGSKPELLAVVALTDANTPIICNGFKDTEFIEMAMLAQKIGRRVIPVVEQYTDLVRILESAKKVGVRPQIGMRVKLATRGAGRWQSSAGYRSKFGLCVSEILRALKELERRGMAGCFKLLHFHLGSQVTNIRFIKTALVEAARVYADLIKCGAGLEFLDVGGGLGVDYDGSQTNFDSSVNYTLQEYANDVIYHVQVTCDDAGVPHPNIMSESGRAIAAYHSVLVFSVLGVSGQGEIQELPAKLDEGVEQPLETLLETYNDLNLRNVLESFHDAQQALDAAMGLFSAGYLPLEQRSVAETCFWAICRKIRQLVADGEQMPEELDGLDKLLADTYFCNFSLFQSMPDSWAIKQLFPVMPIHRLDEEPKRHAVLGDITCDSDGKIDQFIDLRDVKRTLLLHPFDGSPYYLGAFLIGAYQEILGDLHNLFGDTNAVHVDLQENGEVTLEAIVKGDTVSEVLQYVAYDDKDLTHRLQTAVEKAVQTGLLDHREAGRFVRFYEAALQGYTYLKDEG